ncbi:MAG: hypothetical protein Q9220_000286 [cf. Caloplaca sp. 1 TL-2023]
MEVSVPVRNSAIGKDGVVENTSQRPLKKKRSLTRLFTGSRSPSRSRATSVEDLSIPSTPTIPEQYLLNSRKPPHCETPPVGNNDKGAPEHSVLADITNVISAPSEQSNSRTTGLKGILKPEKKAARTHSNPNRSQTRAVSGTRSSGSFRRSKHPDTRFKENQVMHHSPTFPLSARATTANKDGNATPEFPSSRSRKISSASLASSHSQAVPPMAPMPSRPSTSGGERGKVATGMTMGKDDLEGLGLCLGPLSDPIPISDDEIRASFRSALTTSSSLVEASTSRSSVLTKDTSVSELTIESRPEEAADEEMTVDEAIRMYENGFMDDVGSDHDHPSRSSISDEERRRSIRIAEAIDQPMGSQDLVQNLSVTKGLITTPNLLKNTTDSGQPRAPPMTPTVIRDRYGFLKVGRHVSIEQYDAWNRSYEPDQIRRAKKWATYMHEQGCSIRRPEHFPDRSPKTLRYIRKGVPPAWRGATWFYYSGGMKLMEQNPSTYASLIARSQTPELNSSDVEAIERDLHRTFPDNIHFKPDQSSENQSEPELLGSLRRVLQAFATYRPQIGYCQSLNFLAGLLLLFLPEEKTFWMLHIITTEYLPGTHEISLEGANIDLWVLMSALKESNPTIWAKIGVGGEDAENVHNARLPPISLCTTSWFMSLFIGTLPIESVLRVWDILFYEGSKTLFRIALAIFKLGEQRIKEVNDSMELFQVVQAFPRGLLDISLLMGLACRRGAMSQEWVMKKRKERKMWYAKEKARASGAMTPIDAANSPVDFATPSRANSAWRKRVGLVR